MALRNLESSRHARENEKVFTLTEAQTWTVIGTLLVAVFGMMTLMSTLFVRVLHTEIGGLRAEMSVRFEAMDSKFSSRFDAVDVRLDRLDRRVESIERAVDGLEGDVRTLFRRTWGEQ